MEHERQQDDQHDAHREERPQHHATGRIEYRRPGPHGAAAISGELDAADVEADARSGVLGGALSGSQPGVQAEIQRAYRRAERSTKRDFLEVTPRTVVAAEACTAFDGEDDDPTRPRIAPHSRACFLATAAYGDTHAPDVERLRGWRDRHLIGNPFGALLVWSYYRMSPPFARLIARSPRLRVAVRGVIAYCLRAGRRHGPALAS